MGLSQITGAPRAACILILMCAAGTVLTCSDDKTTNSAADGTCPDPASRDDLLQCLCCAYEARDAETYSSLLHQSFRFGFVPDIAESLGLPAAEPWWGRASEVLAASNMFADSALTRVVMNVIDPAWFAWEDTLTGFQGYRARVTPDIRIILEEPGSEETILLVNCTWLDIFVVSDASKPGQWLIVSIEEFGIPGRGFRTGPLGTGVWNMTWSRVRYRFRPLPVR
jgi:hypothetical protein